VTNGKSPNPTAQELEQKALAIGKWANLFMAFAGIAASWASHSDALLIDGLFSGVNFLSVLVAARIGRKVGRPATPSRPWGQDYDETLFVTFRSLVLIGILIFAAFVSGSKIFNFVTGGVVTPLVFGPIAIYSAIIVLICIALAIIYRRAYVKSGRRSSILNTESRAAIIDGALSIVAGAALLSIPFLDGTALQPYLPIGDAVVALLLIGIVIWQPLATFRRTLSELAGVSAPRRTVSLVARAARKLAKADGFVFHRAAVLKAGRFHFAAVYLDPARPVDAAEVDAFEAKLNACLADILGPTRTEIIVTARKNSPPPERR